MTSKVQIKWSPPAGAVIPAGPATPWLGVSERNMTAVTGMSSFNEKRQLA